jgi:F-type H+-transporting ATPase subunit c
MCSKRALLLVVVLALAAPLFAAEEATAAASNRHWIWISSGFAMAFASGICGLAQGKAVAAACEGMARNPSAAAAIRFALILGLALIESLALYTLVIVLLQVRP